MISEQSRRDFIKKIAGAGLGLSLGLSACQSAKMINGSIVGGDAGIGHKLRDGFAFPPPSRTESIDIAIIGAGVSGLSAARKLKSLGKQVVLLELADTPGGNSRGGTYQGKAFPWGAHYLPVPGAEMPEIIDLLGDFGAIYDRDKSGKPLYEETFLCHAPQERLLINGSWQPGLIPKSGLPQKDLMEIQAFDRWVKELKYAKGNDGLPAFTLPLHRSSQDPAFRTWDSLTMAQLIKQKGWSSPFLKWYVNYSCRDDFGGNIDQTSAWAGMHYFCARRGVGGNAKPGDVLTWPEGNFWLTKKMASDLGPDLRCNALVFELNNTEQGATLSYFDLRQGKTIQVNARKVIFSGPQHVASRLLPERKLGSSIPVVPWVTANVVVKKPPAGLGTPLAWDNVSYDSPSLGYVHASHQFMNAVPDKERVLTWYHVLSEDDLLAARRRAAETSYADWQAFVLDDLRSMHPKIEDDIQHLDLWVWGHGMTRPEPGFLTNQDRINTAKAYGNIHFAHTDLSGISIFEEAFYQGLRVADEVV